MATSSTLPRWGIFVVTLMVSIIFVTAQTAAQDLNVEQSCETSIVEWIPTKIGHLPLLALAAGYETPNIFAYVLRTKHNGSLISGKYICLSQDLVSNSKEKHERAQVCTGSERGRSFHQAWYAFGGRSNYARDIEVLVAEPSLVRWHLVDGSNIPDEAIKADEEANYYVCRVARGDSLVPGYSSRASGKCFIEYFGKQYGYYTYEVLMEI